MKNRLPKERIIFDNYGEMYSDEDIIEYIKENRDEDDETEISERDIYRERCRLEEIEWEDTIYNLKHFFKGERLLVTGQIGRWNGVSSGFDVFDDFEKALSFMGTDCDYFKFYDENGHLYLTCTHHDGTCNFEIRVLSDDGYEYLDRWNYSWNDKRKQSDVARQLYKRYSKTPQYMHKELGCKRFEYEKQSKERFKSMLNSQARSFYC